MRRFHAALTVTAAAAIALCAIGIVRPQAAVAADPVHIKIIFPTPITSYTLPYLWAHDSGWLAQHGVETEEIFVQGDSNAARGVLSGEADMGLVGTQTLLEMGAQGSAAKSILSWQPVVDYQFVVRKGGAANIAALKGGTFAADGPGEMLTLISRLLMTKNGVDPDAEKYVNMGGHAARMQAVIAGKADASLINTMTAKQGEVTGQITILRPVAADFPKLGYGWIVARSDKVKDPALHAAYEALVEGSILGARYVAKDPGAAADLLIKRLPQMSPEVIKSAVTELDKLQVWGINGGLDADVIKFSVGISKQLGALKEDVGPDQVFDRSLVDEALKKVGTN